jgi:hypothetical protein
MREESKPRTVPVAVASYGQGPGTRDQGPGTGNVHQAGRPYVAPGLHS